MIPSTQGFTLSRSTLVFLAILGALSAAVLVFHVKGFPGLHTVLDTGTFMLSGALALMFWDVGASRSGLFSRWLAISFAVTSVLECLHAFVSVEWTGFFAPITQAADLLRPTTWPPPAYLLPVGIGSSVWLMRRGRGGTSAFTLALVTLGVILFATAHWLPGYTSPMWLGVTRPTLTLVPLLWMAVVWSCWRLRALDRMLPALAFMAGILLLATVSMLYSRGPHDPPAIVAHLGKVAAYLILVLSLMQMASTDMLERIRAEQELAHLTEELEQRVLDRTAQLESANKSLASQVEIRQRVEGALRQSHERTRSIFDTALDGVITMDHEGRIAEFSPAAEHIFGYCRQDVIGRALADVIVPPTLRDRHRQGLARYLATGEATVLGKRLEITGMRADGSEVALELSINRMPGDVPTFAGFVRDITERKNAEETRARLASIVESTEDAVMGKTLNGVIASWNCGAHKLFGYSADEVIGRPMQILVPPDRPNEEPKILARIARGESVDHFETVRVHKDGRQIDVSVTVSPILDSQGRVVGASSIARDITERKLSDSKVQAQLERLSLLHQITRAIGGREDLGSIYQVVLRSLEDRMAIDFGCICDYDSMSEQLAVVNVGVHSQPLALELALTEQAQIHVDANGLSRCVAGQLVYEPDISEVRMPFPEKLARAGLRSLVFSPLLVESRVFGVFIVARREPNSFSSGECEFLKQLSEHVALAAHQAQLHGALQQAYDDLRQTQQAVMQQERLRALGQMASGIAHDINNAVSPVALYTELILEKETTLSEQSRRYLEVIQRAIDDVAHTVARMREFYRQREPQLIVDPVNLNSLVQQVIDLTRARWSDMPQQRGIAIKMRTELLPNLPTVMGVESEIREALINLIFNAVDAMPEGGTLTVRTNTNEATLPSNQPDLRRNVHVEVTDTGVGMDEETRSHCAEPFFTTKGERGTGLGLATVYGMAQRHSADIDIESAPGLGTTVRLSLAASAPVTAGSVPIEHTLSVPSRLRILVIDDDPLLLKSLSDTLEGNGHAVVTASGGQAGIDAFRMAKERKQPFSVVFTDLGMPYVDGRKVANAIKNASPSTPVILLTGWGQRLVNEGEVPPHVDRVLSKPPKLRDLCDALASSFWAAMV